MIRIVIVCNAAMSSSMIVHKMQVAAQNTGVEVSISAAANSEITNNKQAPDVILLGPQVRYLLKPYQEKFGPLGVAVAVIDLRDYGLVNGEKILNDALKIYTTNKQEH